MKKIGLTILVPAVLAVALITCQKQEEKEAQQSASPLPDESAVAVRVSTVKEGDFSAPVLSSGLIGTGTESRLSFKIGGIIRTIAVKEGQAVVKGQVLAILDLTEIGAQVVQARNNADKAKRDLDRVSRLMNDSAATLEQFQNVTTAYDVAMEGLRIASFNQERGAIKATVSGKVIRKLVNEGEQVGGGTTVLVINSSAENDWIVRVGVPDVDWTRIRKGDRATITTDAYADEPLKGEVTLINEGAEPLSGLYAVEVSVQPGGRKLASGLVASVEIVPSATRHLRSIPIEAVVEGNGNDAFVFVPTPDGRGVKKLAIRIAYITSTDAMVLEGLHQVEKVVTAGSAFLTEFSTIRIEQESGALTQSQPQ